MYRDAARFYDVILESRGRDAAAEADLVIDELLRRRPGATTLLDVACGTGAHLPRFGSRFEVTGLDLSPDMLALAAERCPGVPLHESDMRAFDLGRTFDAVVCLFSAIGYLVEEADLRAAVATMARHLTPGGVLLVEGWVEPEAWRDGTVDAAAAKTPDAAVARVVRSRRDGLVTDVEMRYTVATADGIETFDERHLTRLSVTAEFEAAFAAAGLSFERLPDLLHPGRAVYVGVA